MSPRVTEGLPGEPEPFEKGVLPPPLQGRGLIAIDGALSLLAVLLIVQMWLVTAALESFLAGHHEVALPAAIVSLVLCVSAVGLYLFVSAIDADVRRQ
jgi:hypothetical protein